MKKNIYKEQRIGVFIDIQNLYYSSKHLYKKKVNFKAVLDEAVNSRTLVRAIAYVVRADELKENTFFEALKNIGFDIQEKELQIFAGGMKKGDWDVGIAVDTIKMAQKLDVVVLVSGDGDYAPLVEYLKNAQGCRVEVIAFGRSTSSKLKEVADEFIDLDSNKKFLMSS
ncbi:NYN domain-containing protein [Candidatus Woesearchaeota archaeon]|nr:NYN domain-containing protein [Candidatus Woesearchaeota archaeon]